MLGYPLLSPGALGKDKARPCTASTRGWRRTYFPFSPLSLFSLSPPSPFKGGVVTTQLWWRAGCRLSVRSLGKTSILGATRA